MALFMKIKDKVDVKGKKGEELFCPPHCIPHKLPFSKPICDEPCHYHKKKWRMIHHTPFCFLFCPNFKIMIEEYKKYKKVKKNKIK
jgi:hypothetical protein